MITSFKGFFEIDDETYSVFILFERFKYLVSKFQYCHESRVFPSKTILTII